ncbi:MAG: hypothetical protein HGA42_19500 [Nostocales cyanobacterium W4_Combined_metabat2_030]|nr:hypothetical protein [Nostocales cyanobacterium W4_Combined_metabat2_030]
MTKTSAELEKEGHRGIDADLAISLFEYGFAYLENDQDGQQPQPHDGNAHE